MKISQLIIKCREEMMWKSKDKGTNIASKRLSIFPVKSIKTATQLKHNKHDKKYVACFENNSLCLFHEYMILKIKKAILV
jgi:hypothetical protein